MDINEKAGITVRIYESTANKIKKWKGKAPTGLFLDNAVECYIKTMENCDAINNINSLIGGIDKKQRITLGLLCEVLKKQGILDDNFEIQLPEKLD